MLSVYPHPQCPQVKQSVSINQLVRGVLSSGSDEHSRQQSKLKTLHVCTQTASRETA